MLYARAQPALNSLISISLMAPAFVGGPRSFVCPLWGSARAEFYQITYLRSRAALLSLTFRLRLWNSCRLIQWLLSLFQYTWSTTNSGTNNKCGLLFYLQRIYRRTKSKPKGSASLERPQKPKTISKMYMPACVATRNILPEDWWQMFANNVGLKKRLTLV